MGSPAEAGRDRERATQLHVRDRPVEAQGKAGLCDQHVAVDARPPRPALGFPSNSKPTGAQRVQLPVTDRTQHALSLRGNRTAKAAAPNTILRDA